MLLAGEDANILEELAKSRADILCFGRLEIRSKDGIQRESIDDLSRTLTKYDSNPSYSSQYGELDGEQVTYIGMRNK